MQSLRAKLSSEIRETDQSPRLENLKSKLRTAYKLAREIMVASRTRPTNATMIEAPRNGNSLLVILFVQPCNKGGRVLQIPSTMGWSMMDN